MLPSTTSLLMVFGIILLVVIASITKKAIPIIRSKDFSHCYIKLYLDVLLQTIVLGGSLSASVMLTDNTLEIPTTSSATIVILFSLMNILLICLQFIYSKVEKRVRSSRQQYRSYASQTTANHQQQRLGKRMPTGWTKLFNDDGIPYYFNTTTGETRWRMPGPSMPSLNAPRPMQSHGPRLFSTKQADTNNTVLVVPIIARSMIQNYTYFAPLIFGLVDCVFDIIAALYTGRNGPVSGYKAVDWHWNIQWSDDTMFYIVCKSAATFWNNAKNTKR
eukprot:875588_1